jgi:Asp-tRNA(Asn)/Glu-tRNA(Gln) amidotransferase A subunit family amidase
MVMIYESHNYMFGRACNPWDKHRTTGGSSGGEGGLIACRGSVVGVGCDIGGSIRIPSEFCGVYGLKPSSHRLSFKGHM